MRLKYLPLLLLGLVPALPADELPELGEPSQAVVSPQQEREIGQQGMLQIRSQAGYYLGDSEINDYLNWLGGRLVAASSDPGMDFEFFALNDHNINAFSMPGGYVGVNTGLILDTQTESELAAVLAHEVTHVTQHHIARMIAGQKYDSLTSLATAALAILAARNNPGLAGGILAGPAAQIQRQLKFTREHEQEADRIGLVTLENAGFDVRAMPAFFRRLERDTRLLDNSAPTWLRTHPMTTDRIADIDNRVRQMPFKLVPDSLEYQLVRNKLMVLDRGPQDSITYFTDALGPRKFGNPVAQRYGLTLALLKSGDAVRAKQELQILLNEPQAASDPMIATLAGRIYHATGMSNAKLQEYYANAVQDYPHHRALAYDYAGVLFDAKRYDAALQLLDDRINEYPDDARLYELEAKAYAAVGKPQAEHHSLAYAYISRGNLMGAIDQLTLAKQSGNDYYQLSVIDGELKQFRAIAAAQAGAKGK